jgi:hypothetical protein
MKASTAADECERLQIEVDFDNDSSDHCHGNPAAACLFDPNKSGGAKLFQYPEQVRLDAPDPGGQLNDGLRFAIVDHRQQAAVFRS